MFRRCWRRSAISLLLIAAMMLLSRRHYADADFHAFSRRAHYARCRCHAKDVATFDADMIRHERGRRS